MLYLVYFKEGIEREMEQEKVIEEQPQEHVENTEVEKEKEVEKVSEEDKKELEKEELRDSVRQACEDYASIVVTETSAVSSGITDSTPSQSIASIDKVLARIDEFAMFIENMEDEAKNMKELSEQLSAQAKNIQEVFAMIDALALYIRQVSTTVNALEDRAAAAEKFFGAHARKTFLKSIPLFRKNIAAEAVMDSWVSVPIPPTSKVIESIPGRQKSDAGNSDTNSVDGNTNN